MHTVDTVKIPKIQIQKCAWLKNLLPIFSLYLDNEKIKIQKCARIVFTNKRSQAKVSTVYLLMYSAHCRQPGETSQANQDDDQDLAKQRREKESHRG